MKNFLTFNIMLGPILIQWFFWLGLLICLGTGIMDLLQHKSWLLVLQVWILGPIAIRIISEFAILFFKIHQSLQEIKTALIKKDS